MKSCSIFSHFHFILFFPGERHGSVVSHHTCTPNNCRIREKSAQRVQTPLAKAAHYPQIDRIHDLKSQHGDPDHPKL